MTECSIITVCWNAEKVIAKTIESVLNQNIDKNRIEYVFVDGDSKDNTVGIIKEYQKKYKELKIRYISEKDKGIYDAMNKGANLAKGTWCIYLNAGDEFFNCESLGNLLDVKDKDNYDIVYGDTIYNYENKYKIVRAKETKDINYMRGMEFCHQSCIIKTEYQRNNPYTLEYRIAGDCDFFTRSFVNHAKFYHVNKIVSIFVMDGISSTKGALSLKENSDIKLKYGLIDKKKHFKETFPQNIKISLRKITPKKLIKKRHDLIFEKNVKNWFTYEELLDNLK